MEELIKNYCTTATTTSVSVVHAPLVPAAKQLGELVAKTLAEHPAKDVFKQLAVFGCVNKTTKISDEDKTKLLDSGAFKADSTLLQDVSLCVTAGAAESAAAASLATRAAGAFQGFCAPIPGVFYVASPACKDRSVFVPTTQMAKISDPVTLHVLHAPQPLSVRYINGNVEGGWHDKMCGLRPIWWTKEGPCGQVMFPKNVNDGLTKMSAAAATVELREGDTLVMPPGTPLWFTTEGTAILHSTTFCRVPEGDPNMESAASEWRRWHRLGGILDPGPNFRGGAPFFATKGLPPFSGNPMFPADKSLVFQVDVAGLQSMKPAKITSTETDLLFWIGFVHKLVEAIKVLESRLWSAEFEQKHREHLKDWLDFFLEPNGKVKHVIKTSTVRSALSTLCDTVEKLSARALFFKKWIPRFEDVSVRFMEAELKFPNGSELENRRREAHRIIRDLQKVASWPKTFQQGKDNLIEGVTLEAEALLVADPSRWPQNPPEWLANKRKGLESFRDDAIPQDKVDELEAMIDACQGDTPSCLAIDKAFHALYQLFDPEGCGPYVSPLGSSSSSGSGSGTTTKKQQRKRERSSSPSSGGGGSPDSNGNDDDDEEIDIENDDSELAVGTVVRDILARRWNGSVSSMKTECASCHEKSIPLAYPYCVGCCQQDLHTLIFQSLTAGLTVFQKRGLEGQESLKERIKALQKKEKKNEHVFDRAHGRAEQVKVFKELLDEFAAIQQHFADIGIVLAEHEDAEDLEEYGDASAMSASEDEEDDDEEEEEEEEEFSSSSSSYESRRRKKRTPPPPISSAESLALDLLRFRQERGTFIAQQEEMETLCVAGDEKSVAAARVLLDKLKALPSQWCVDIYDVDAKTTQLCESLGWFSTEKEATKAMTVHVALHSHLKGKATFSVREKKNQPQ